MAESPLVSVIIPTHRRPDWLRRALASALAQTYPALDIHVVENGGRAGADRVVMEMTRPERPIHYHYVKAGNVAAARNYALTRTRAPYCAFLDDDDEWLPDKLTLQLQALEADGHLGWIGCRVWFVSPSGEVQLGVNPLYRGTPSFAALVREGCFIQSPSCVVVRRECFRRAGLFDPRWFRGADYELYLRLARHFAFTVLDEPLVRYHQHGQNMSGDLDVVVQTVLRVLSTVRPLPARGVTKATIREAIGLHARWLYGRAIDARDEGRHGVAAASLWAIVRHDPAIGLRIPWSRVDHPAYRVARPYVNLAVCGARAWLRPPHIRKGSGADRVVS